MDKNKLKEGFMIRSEKIDAVAAALLAVQGKIQPVKTSAKNDFIGNRYSTLEDVLEASIPALQESGLALVQLPESTDGKADVVGLTTLLVHAASGQYIGGTLSIPVLTEKGKSAAQVVGSGISYARRYGIMAILGLVQEDDDGNASGGQQRQPASRPQQVARPVVNPIDVAFDAMAVPIQARATLYDNAVEQAKGDKTLAAGFIAGWARDGYKWNETTGTLIPKKQEAGN